MDIKKYLNNSLLDFESYKISKPKEKINLGSNESPYNLMENSFFKKGYQEILNDLDLNRYPDPASTNLRKVLAEYVNVDPENIIAGCGADEVINIILSTFVNPDDVIITHSPSFEMYEISSKIVHGRVIRVDDLDHRIDIDKIIEESNFNKAKLVFLCSPNNPTGYITPLDDVQRLIDNTESLIVLDMAYIEFSDEKYEDLVLNDRVICLRTLSKAFGLASLRVGYAVAEKNIINAMNLTRPPYNLNELSQRLAVFTVENRDKIYPFIDKIKTEKIRFWKLIEELGYKILPSSSNFILLKIDKDIEEFQKRINEKDIRIRFYSDKTSLKNYFRITVGLPEENDKIIEVLRGIK